jgi:hypothetical protein
MSKEFTDFELASHFGTLVGQTYGTAVKFIELNPDHALVEFRALATLLCNYILDNYNEHFQCRTLEEKIDFLADSQLISTGTKSNFHKIRKYGNSSAHKHDLISAKDKDYFLKLSKENLVQDANEVRNLIVNIFSDLYVFSLKKGTLGKVILLEDKSEGYKEILFEGAISNDSVAKFAAGMVYKSLADDYSKILPLVVSAEDLTKLILLQKCALSHFKASYELSVNTGLAILTEKEKNDRYLKLCDLKPLYEYASLKYETEIGENSNSEGVTILQVAADRGFGPAEADIAIYLYDEVENYLLAKDFADKAVRQNIPDGHRLLFYYFSEGKAIEPNIEIALDHIFKAISSGSTQAMFDLGLAYRESESIEQDIELSKKYLLMAIEKGHQKAFLYHELHFNNLAEKMASQFKCVGEQMLSALESQKQVPIRSQKKRPNDKCSCGSGLKYKKCHGSPTRKSEILEEVRNSLC